MKKSVIVGIIIGVVIIAVTIFLVWEFALGDEDKDLEGDEGEDLEDEGNWVEEGIRIKDPYFFDVSVVKLDNGKYRMYGEKHAIIESYISSDGLLWEKEQGTRLENAGFPYVMKTSDGKWRLFYTPSGAGAQQNKFFSAISSDGINFEIEEGYRFDSGDAGERIQGPRIVYLEDGSYRMYYTSIIGLGVEEKSIILSAKSDDGFNFVKEDGMRLNPESEPFVGARVAHAWPVKTPEGITLFFAGATTKGGGILSATSTNGLDFDVKPVPEIKEMSTEEVGIEEAGIGPQDACAILMDGGLRIYYGIYKGPDVVEESAIYSAFNDEF